MRNQNQSTNYFCSQCLKNILPFQNMNEDLFLDEIDSISMLKFLTDANLKNVQLLNKENHNVDHDIYYFYNELESIFTKGHKELSMLHVNIVSLITNLTKLKELLLFMKIPPDIICISETYLKKKLKVYPLTRNKCNDLILSEKILIIISDNLLVFYQTIVNNHE